MGKCEFVVLTPAGSPDPSLAIAACRAGACGVLDLEYARDPQAALDAVERLERFTSSGYGVKLGRDSGPLLTRLFPRNSRCNLVILAGGDHSELEEWLALLREQGVRVLFEAVSLVEALRGEQLGVDGLVLKGNESGGRVGTDTSFILLQRWLKTREPGKPVLPVWVQGGIGFNTAPACAAVGAAGVVLDVQLGLAQESSLAESARGRLSSFDGSETICVGEKCGEIYRVYSRPGLAALDELRREESRLESSSLTPTERLAAWREAVRQRVETGPERGVWLVGQDAAFARGMAARFATVGGVVQALRERVASQVESARRLQPLAEGSPLARRHGTRYPVVQGPMTRVSDTAAFAGAVAEAGGLPFLALALLRRAEAEKLLQETSRRLAGRPWGAGVLGFAPPEIRREQAEAIRATRPPFALIAGGRPDQARELEKEGIPTYLHVPSPGLLSLFLKDGARRFVFEGRECGGHVGPRSSFVLWETMCELLLGQIAAGAVRGEELHVLFAGGIHDARSAAMVGTLSAGLAERGVAVGVLVGTAYLFTEEAVASEAIVAQYQQEALSCRETVLLETGPGHAIRCVNTPYAEAFEQEKRRLQAEGRTPDEIREALEALNVGRLRVASKGLDRAVPGAEAANGAAKLIAVEPDEQRRRGMYMIGQAACLRERVITMAELHEDVCSGSSRLLRELPAEQGRVSQREKPSEVAIIGMACILPGASELRAHWENVLAKVNAVTEVPGDHWDWRLYYDPNSKARDKINSKWGGFLADMPFDPLQFGMPPSSLPSIEPVQLYALEAVRRALADAGYAERPFDRERTAVILGAGGGASQLAISYSFRSYLPMLATVPGLEESAAEIVRKAEAVLPEWTEDSFPGILINVIAGRVANRFNLGGPNFSIDAACGSSLAALYAGVRELEMGTSDMAVVFGADTVQNPYTYLAFSKTQAFSPRGRCSTFDESADGIVISEGVAVVILKRLADAERDGDRVYAVVKGMGASSDGKDKGLTAPRPEGQLRALRRAYAKAGVSPAQVGFVEAHGTGTAVGDLTEATSLAQVFREAEAAPRGCAVGSVKSMIGHTKCAAGLAGLVNAALALHHKTLPPLLVEKPNSKIDFEKGPLFLNTEARPWIHGGPGPRYAGVSAFGFGGTNFHAVLEEYTGNFLPRKEAALARWPAELFVWRRPSREALVAAVEATHDALARGAEPELTSLAFSVWKSSSAHVGQPTLVVVAGSVGELKEKLAAALGVLRSTEERHHDPRGVFFAAAPGGAGKVAFLFPGQGSQYPNMLAQLALVFPEVRQAFDEAEGVLAGKLERPLGRFIFPPSAFGPEQERQARQELTRTEVAQPAIGAASLGMLRLLAELGVEPDLLAGHSYGDYVALHAAGTLPAAELIELSHQRGRILREATEQAPGGMAALRASGDEVAAALEGLEGVTAANWNGPRQTVIAGTAEGIEAALERCRQKGIRGQRLAVACGFHSPLVAGAHEPFARVLAKCPFAAPRLPVYANSTAAVYPSEPGRLVDLLADHLVSPVRFHEEVEAMYQAGARTFIEVGPQGVLTGLVGQILADRPHLAIASDLEGRSGLVQVQHLLGQLLTAGLPVRLDRLYEGRPVRQYDLVNLEKECAPPRPTPSTWLVNSARVRPINGPEPKLLGQVRSREASTPPAASPPVSATPKPVPPTAMKNNATPPAREEAGETPALRQGRTAEHPGASANGTNGYHHAPPATTPAAGDESAQVMMRFQDLMARFLETQRSVMLTYLQGAPPAPGSVPPLPPSLPLPLPAGQANGNGTPAPIPAAPIAPPLQQPVQPAPVAVAPAPPAPPPAAVPTPGGMDREGVTARLLEIVCKRTGYPPEMLGLDLDLEADLGIDSIKRVEILGSLADAVSGGQAINGSMEKLTTIKSLRGIIDCLLSGVESAKPVSASKDVERGSIQRMLVTVADAPLQAPTVPELPGGTLLVTDDGRGIARALAGRLQELGQNVALVSSGSASSGAEEPGVFHANLSEPGAVEDLLARVHEQCGPIRGLVHLLPLASSREDRPWAERMDAEVKSLFLLARGLADELRRAAGQGPAVLLAATGMGGCFGAVAGETPDDFFPGQGGVAGLVKGLAHEWPEVLVRVVDLDPGDEAAELAGRLLEEMSDADGPVEIGYTSGRRVTLRCVPSPLLKGDTAGVTLTPESTVLLTGGARGITAAVALELALRYRPNLVLVGRSALPEEQEETDTAGLSGAAELKGALIARLRREGRPASPAAVEAAYHRLLHDREIRANLVKLKETGARVHYYQADVRDEAAFTGVLEDVYRRFGGIDGVIHGAGVIQDKLIRDKTPESYDRVFGTKVESALILARHLKPERLKFCVFFASVAGRFGNRGQCDYAAANEVLSKLAIHLDRRWPGRVVSLVWGPWSGIGMVSELEGHLGQRGLQMIPPDVGPLFLDEELRQGKKGECEVVVAGDVGQLARPERKGRPEKVGLGR